MGDDEQAGTELRRKLEGKPFQPGYDPRRNLGGRPKKLPITEAYAKIFGDPVTAEAYIRSIMKSKSQIARTMVLEKASERLEGKVTQPVDISGELNLTLSDRMSRAKARLNDTNE